MTSAADRAEVRGQRDLEDDMRPRARLYNVLPTLTRPIFGPGPRHREYGLNDILQNYLLLKYNIFCFNLGQNSFIQFQIISNFIYNKM